MSNSSSDLYRKIFDQALDMIFVADVETGIIVDCNKEASSVLGWTREELIGSHQTMLHPEEDRTGTFSRSFQEHVTHKNDQIVETRVRKKNGQLMEVAIKASIFRHEGRNLILGIFRDIGFQRYYEAQIRSLARFPDENPNPVLRVASDGTAIYTNQAARKLMGQSFFKQGRKASPLFRDVASRALATREIESFEVAKNGRTYQISAAPVSGEGYVNFYGLDVTDRKRAEEALQRSEEQYRLAQMAARIGSWDYEVESGRVHWSQGTEGLFGLERGEFKGTFASFLKLVHPEDRDLVLAAVESALDNKEEYDIEHRVLWPGGQVRWMRETGAVMCDAQGRTRHMMGIVQDITEHKEMQEHIHHLALHDPLTGLFNRRAFEDHLARILKESDRHGSKAAVLFLDLDHFKEVNDCYGHALGDEVLREVSSLMRDSVREVDILARVGGDEFVIALTDLEDDAYVGKVAERLLASVTEPLQVGGEEHRVGMSIGVALYPDHGATASELMRKADAAMYKVKGAGRGAWRHAGDE